MFCHDCEIPMTFVFLCYQANPLPHGLDKIPDAQGYLVLNADGAVLAVSVNFFTLFCMRALLLLCRVSWVVSLLKSCGSFYRLQ